MVLLAKIKTFLLSSKFFVEESKTSFYDSFGGFLRFIHDV